MPYEIELKGLKPYWLQANIENKIISVKLNRVKMKLIN